MTFNGTFQLKRFYDYDEKAWVCSARCPHLIFHDITSVSAKKNDCGTEKAISKH